MLCRTAKSKAKPYKIFDRNGLYLEVYPTGSKLWRLKYRYHRKEKRISLGNYPLVTLLEARQEKDKIKAQLKSGHDPILVKLEQQQTAVFAHAQTFELIGKEWHSQNAPAWNPRYAKTILHRLEKYLFPDIGSYPITLLTPVIILSCLRKIDENAPDMARRIKQLCSNVFVYAKNTNRVQSDITTGLEKGLRKYEKGHFASIDVDELANFLIALHDFRQTKIHRQTYLAIQFMLLTFVRTTELNKATWSEINFETAIWRIPGKRMKKKKDHLTPLSRQAIAILKELKEMNGKREYIFPSIPRPLKPMSNGTILQALKRMKFETHMTGHGFRSLALGILKEKLGYTHEIADRQLAHVRKNNNDKAYDRAEFLDQRTEMMQRYADYIDKVFIEELTKRYNYVQPSY
ncbi:Integrase [Mucilaginibacter polytrichastri]|nr:Integrase [Mucilaginibacter polytrichastri]